MHEHKYAEAKALLDQIIANGKTTKGDKYELVNFFSNFNPAQDNNAESIFAYQASVNDGSGTNGNYGDNLNYPNGLGFGCCGFFNPSISARPMLIKPMLTGCHCLKTMRLIQATL